MTEIQSMLKQNPPKVPVTQERPESSPRVHFLPELSDNEKGVLDLASEETPERRGAALLLSMTKIASNEIQDDACPIWRAKDPVSTPCPILWPSLDSDLEEEDEDPMTLDERFQWSRIRTVSLDCQDEPRSSPVHHHKGKLAVVSPGNSPLPRKRKPTSKLLLQLRSESPLLKPKSGSSSSKRAAPSAFRGPKNKTILRKKFSWKNAPELEAFLIANREEYLRHSALNYTVQQKQYNNRLTERLLKLAAEHGYTFDEESFNFVTVRDRIRCYYKSYVQSAKKRGVIIGYAARKAGLLSEEELNATGTGGRIVMPEEESY